MHQEAWRLTSLGNKPLKALKTDISGKIWKEKKSEYNQLVSHNNTPNRSANEKTIRGGVAKQAFVRRGICDRNNCQMVALSRKNRHLENRYAWHFAIFRVENFCAYVIL